MRYFKGVVGSAFALALAVGASACTTLHVSPPSSSVLYLENSGHKPSSAPAVVVHNAGASSIDVFANAGRDRVFLGTLAPSTVASYWLSSVPANVPARIRIVAIPTYWRDIENPGDVIGFSTSPFVLGQAGTVEWQVAPR